MSDPRPQVGPATEAVYGGLPELYRDADAAQDTGPSNYPLLRFLALVLDQATPLAEYVARFTYDTLDERDNTDPAWPRYGTGTLGEGTYGGTDTADLVDPHTADAGWLPWLAQLLGVDATGLTPEETRDRLVDPSTAWAHGTPGAITDRVRPALAGGGYVDVVANYQGDPFTIALVTKADDTGTLTPADVEALAEPERPAGFLLPHVYLDDFDNTPPPPPPPPNLMGEAGTMETDAAVAAWVHQDFNGTYPNAATAARSTARASEGASSMLVTWGDTRRGGRWHLVTGLTVGRTYRVTADLYIPAGSPSVELVLRLREKRTRVTTRDAWVTVALEYVAPSTQQWVGVATPEDADVDAGERVYVDNVTFELVT